MGDDMPFDVTMVHLDGESSSRSAARSTCPSSERLWTAIEQVISPDQPLVLDMHRVTFFDISGLRVLLRALERLDRDPAMLVLRSPSSVVRRVLSVTETDQLMTIQGARDDVRRTKHRPQVAEPDLLG